MQASEAAAPVEPSVPSHMTAGSKSHSRVRGAELETIDRADGVTEEVMPPSAPHVSGAEDAGMHESNENMGTVLGLVHQTVAAIGEVSSPDGMSVEHEHDEEIQDSAFFRRPPPSSPLAAVAGLASNNIYAILPIEEVRDSGGSHSSPSDDRANVCDLDAELLPDAVCAACDVEEGAGPTWRRRQRRKALGDVAAHARYLQHVFRRTRSIRPGCWSRGGMRGLIWYRPVAVYGCRGGLLLASPSEFTSQRARANDAQRWYRNYVLLLQRLSSGRTPTALVSFCSQGGTSAGVLRAGGAAHGQDLRPQPRYEKKFGHSKFSLGDSADAMQVRGMRTKIGAFVTLASPPCKSYSTALFRGVPSEEPLIASTRDALRAAGGLYAIENVVGAKGAMEEGTALLRGCYFGERVDRPRLFETNFRFHVDAFLRDSGNSLRERTCLGMRRRWRRVDPFGRPVMHDCCGGNLWAVQGDKPLRCTVAECEKAMGVDAGHMDYDGLSQAIPPSYGEYLFSQACMREVERKFGIQAITYDDYLLDRASSERKMAHWLRGVGSDDPTLGVSWAKAGVTSEQMIVESPVAAAESIGVQPKYSPQHKDGTGDLVLHASEQTVTESEWRELGYSWAGGYDRVVGSEVAAEALSPIRPLVASDSMPIDVSGRGKNTLVIKGSDWVQKNSEELSSATRAHPGTRFTVEARGWRSEHALSQAGFRLVRRVLRGAAAYTDGSASARSARPRSYWAVGLPYLVKGEAFDYATAEVSMDPADRAGAEHEPSSAKAARSYMPIPWDPKRWDIGLPAELDQMMAREGVGIYPVDELGPTEVPFYKWANDTGLIKSIAEADRAILAGAMEYIPESRCAEVLATATIHPWTIVDQGGGKWRLCHDYSTGTNRRVPSYAFTLPSVWDVAPVVTNTSFFAKYDIRDGFWHVPIADDSKKRLVVRHPGTGRLIWATRLPFGYLEAPRLFCGVTEAVIARLRQRAAGKGIYFYVFVDDVLCVGDSEELTREGMQMLEEEFADRGLQWAPHKRRGPCQCIEFLGLLLSNVEGQRGVTITRKRLVKMTAEIERWMSRRTADGSSIEADPVELASLLGKLVFVSQVVNGGRVYMQGMLAQFQGLVVDWRRGTVSTPEGSSRRLLVGETFWRDLDWWTYHLRHRCLAPFGGSPENAVAVFTGTDASGWGTGQVAWLDGAREEAVLRFTHAEKRRPINWRELLGVVRIAELWGSRLRGRVVLIETDNMAARGAASKMSSKAADMQELIRRLYSLSELHGFQLRVTHTPGEKLDRPDQTSRGDAVEEPRFALRPALFREIEKRWGPFEQLVGAERAWAASPRSDADVRRLWVHPTFNTVGSALRLVQEALLERPPGQVVVVALVPDDERPAWNSLMRYGRVMGRIGSGEEALLVSEGSVWRPATTRRPMRVVVFPRAAESVPRRIWLSHREGFSTVSPGGLKGLSAAKMAGSGYTLAGDGLGLSLPVAVGSYVYALPKEGGPGTLYVVDTFGPEVNGHAYITCRSSLLVQNKAAQKLAFPLFEFPKGGDRHRPDVRDLWTVDHLVEASARSFVRYPSQARITGYM